jgi:hypothetical protein
LENALTQQISSPPFERQPPLASLTKRATQPLWFQNQRSPTSRQQSQDEGFDVLRDEGQGTTIMAAPDGVPSILNWKEREDGGISGLIYGSMNAQDGDYIETSTIVKGKIDGGHVVQTLSGSRYFLSAESSNNLSRSILDAIQKISNGGIRTQGTITIPDSNSSKSKNMQNGKRPESAKDTFSNTDALSPRSTFSLLDLFASKADERQANTIPFSRLPPTLDVSAPEGVPTLTDWQVNDDGSLTGYVYGSDKIGDGNLVTTSPIANGKQKQYEVVTTLSGSLYWLA